MNPTVFWKKLSLLYVKVQSMGLLFSTYLWPLDNFLIGKDIKKAGSAHDNTLYKSCENSDDKIKFLESSANHLFQ